MYLKDYLYRKKITHEDFAKALGVSYVTLWRVMEGRNHPSYPLLMKIYKITNKRVGLDEIVSPADRARTRVVKSKHKKTR